MSKKSVCQRNENRRRILEDSNLAFTRQRLKDIKRDIDKSLVDRLKASHELHGLVKDSSSIRCRRRCFNCGKPRGIKRFFRACDMCIASFARDRKVPGFCKNNK